MKKLIAFTGVCIWAAGSTHAGQAVNYSYDALGRLVVVQTGVPGNGTVQNFYYDAAGNRTSYQTLLDVALSAGSTSVNLSSTGATLTVDISNPSATGTVTVTGSNGAVLGSASVSNGQATVVLQGLSKGMYTVTATYSGDGADAPQTTNFSINVQNLGWLPAVLQLVLQ